MRVLHIMNFPTIERIVQTNLYVNKIRFKKKYALCQWNS